MIEYVPQNGLGFSLKPPKWLRQAVGQVITGTKVTLPTVTVPTPGGGTATYTPPSKPTLAEQANAAVEQIPGGWITIAALAGAALLILPRMLARRRG